MTELERTLSFPVVLLISINSIMGTGVFFLPAIAAGVAGNASILAWLAMAFIAILLSFVFAELASMYPTAGGVYEYCKQAFGALPSFLVGWLTLIVGNVTIAMLVVGAIRYLNPALPIYWKVAFSILFVLMFNYLAFRGMQTSSVMLVTFALITIGSVLALTIPGLWQADFSRLIPFLDHPRDDVFLAVFLVAETFFGWETATFLAEETKDARRVIPRALILSTLIIAVMVLAFVVASIAAVGAAELAGSPVPLTFLAEALYGAMASPIFSILVYVSIIGSVAGWIVSAPRLLMTLAKDKLFLPSLAAIHPTHKTPHKAILFQTLLSSGLIIVGAGSYELLLELLVPLVLVMYAAVVIALLVLRIRRPELERLYRLPFAPLTCVLLVATLLSLVGFWAFTAEHAPSLLRVAGSLLLAGIPVYALLKYTYDPDAVMRSAAMSGRLSVLLENVLFPRKLRMMLLDRLDLVDKRVLEYGAGVGTVTLHLAEAVGPGGVVTATEFSRSNARITGKRMKDKGHGHVRVIHDEHHLNRVHPDVGPLDVVVSVGYLSYVQDLHKVLREIRERIEHNGQVLFVEYVDYFKLLPNAGWAADAVELERIFREEGFSVRVEKHRGFLWNYLVVHGIRSDDDVPFV